MVDVTIPFGNQQLAFIKAHKHKLEKYKLLADNLRSQGYKGMVEAQIVEALQQWDPSNTHPVCLLSTLPLCQTVEVPHGI